MNTNVCHSEWRLAIKQHLSGRLPAMLIGLVAVIFSILAAANVSAAVTDNGHFFAPSDVVLANQMITRMKATTGKTVVVQTYDTIPPAVVKQYPHAGLHQLFYRWAGTIGRSQHVNGIVIIICRQPGYLIIRSGKATLKSVFTQADQKGASQLMLDLFRSGQYQSGLLSGLRYITRVVEQRAAQLPPAKGLAAQAVTRSRPAPWHRMMILIAVLLGIFVLFWLVTRRSRGVQSPMMGGPAGGIDSPTAGLTPGTTVPGTGMTTGGSSAMGSFMSGMAGGAVGAVAGNMLYNAIEGNAAASEGATAPESAAASASDASVGNGTVPPPDNAADWSDAGSVDAAGGSFGGSNDDSDADSPDDTPDPSDDTADDNDDGGSF
jgi:uncharacterized membrane protein YgcG